MKPPKKWIVGIVAAIAGIVAITRSNVMKPSNKPSQKPNSLNSYTKAVTFPLIKPNRIIIRYLGVFGNPKNPYRQGYGYHSGVDYYGNGKNNGFGDPVVAVADGVVIRSTPVLSPRGYGEMVVIRHPQFDVWTRYAHLNTRQVAEGAIVKAGQQIGTLGTSGTDNAHLHFDVIKKAALRDDWRGIPQSGFTEAQVKDIFFDPLEWLKNQKAVNLGDL